jgi:predicted Zn-dependent peptidase
MKIKHVLLAAVLMGSINATAKDYHYTTVPGDAMKTRIYTLDNGLKVYMSVNKEKPRLQANIAVKTGSRNDPAETTGLAHYLEHLMFKGTQKFGTTDYAKEKPYLDEITKRYETYRKLTDQTQRKQAYHEIDSISQLAAKYNIPNEYDKLMSSIGSQGTNAYTANDVTCYVENIPNNEIENWAKVQSDRFQNMVIRGFHTELEAVYEEKNISMASDNTKEFAAIWKLLTPTHPYGTQTTIGEQEHLKNPSIINIQNYFHRNYAPNNVAICMAGDFDPDQTIAIIDKYFGSWKKNNNLSRPEFGIQPDITAVKDSSVVGKEAENVMLAWKFKGMNDKENDVLDVISEMLSNGNAGLMDVDLEQQMKLASSGAFIYGLHDYSAFIVAGTPNKEQKLEEVRTLLLQEMDKLRKGEFDDNLLSSVIANKKLNFYKSLDDNDTRASIMVDAFVNDQKWADVATQLERQSKLTKQDIMNFADKYLRADNFVCVYKRMGEDTTLKKIEKPAITPIPANREYESAFVKEIKNAQVPEIQPEFLDFKKDLTVSKTSKKLPLVYKQNTQDDLFDLVFRYEFGDEDDIRYSYAAQYLDYIGTDKKSVSAIKQAFYKLACNYSVVQSAKTLQISLNGLNENLPAALNLLEEVLQNAKADKTSWNQFVDLIEKTQQDAKATQKTNFSYLWDYSTYGPYNPTRHAIKTADLRKMDPQALINLLGGLNKMEHTVAYYGPYSEKQLNAILAKEHKTAKKLAAVPEGKEYVREEIKQNEIYIAPYEAKNIYLRSYQNTGKKSDVKDGALIALFNEYYGGGMNSVVFQELRETRGLAYNAGAYYYIPVRKEEKDYFMKHIISQNDKMMDCISVFDDITNNFPQNEASFNLAKQSLKKSLQSRRTTKAGVINAYFNAKLRGIDYDVNKLYYDQLPSLTLQDLTNFEKQNIVGKPYRMVILGDEKNLDMKSLEKIAPIKRLSQEEIFGY